MRYLAHEHVPLLDVWGFTQRHFMNFPNELIDYKSTRRVLSKFGLGHTIGEVYTHYREKHFAGRFAAKRKGKLRRGANLRSNIFMFVCVNCGNEASEIVRTRFTTKSFCETCLRERRSQRAKDVRRATITFFFDEEHTGRVRVGGTKDTRWAFESAEDARRWQEFFYPDYRFVVD